MRTTRILLYSKEFVDKLSPPQNDNAVRYKLISHISFTCNTFLRWIQYERDVLISITRDILHATYFGRAEKA